MFNFEHRLPDGYGPSETDGTTTLTLRRPAGSMWVVVPLETAWQCERLIGTKVVVRRRRDGSYVVEPRRPRMTSSKITRSQVIVEMRQASMASCSWSLPSRPQGRKVGTAVGTVAVGTGIRMKNRPRPPELSRRAA